MNPKKVYVFSALAALVIVSSTAGPVLNEMGLQGLWLILFPLVPIMAIAIGVFVASRIDMKAYSIVDLETENLGLKVAYLRRKNQSVGTAYYNHPRKHAWLKPFEARIRKQVYGEAGADLTITFSLHQELRHDEYSDTHKYSLAMVAPVRIIGEAIAEAEKLNHKVEKNTETKYSLATYIVFEKLHPQTATYNYKRSITFYQMGLPLCHVMDFKDTPWDELEPLLGLPVSWVKKAVAKPSGHANQFYR